MTTRTLSVTNAYRSDDALIGLARGFVGDGATPGVDLVQQTLSYTAGGLLRQREDTADAASSITQRELPQPDASAIDPSDYAQLSRLSYAEPFSMSGNVDLTFHCNPTNGVRNNRIDSI